MGFEPRRPGVHSGLAWYSVTRLRNFLEPCFPAGSSHPLWKALGVFSAAGVYMGC